MKIKDTLLNLLISPVSQIMLFVLCGGFLIYLFSYIYILLEQGNSDPISIMSLLIIGILLFLILAISSINSTFYPVIRTLLNFISFGKIAKQPNSYNSLKLRKRIILSFSIGATLPAVIISVFSIYFFNISVQSWFDSKVSKVLDQSLLVGESYISEHVLQLKETALSVIDDLNDIYYEVINDNSVLSNALNSEANYRLLDEAIVFQRSTNKILAKTSLSFSLSFAAIPTHLLELANTGAVIRIPSDRTKIRMIAKLNAYPDTYLLIGRVVDPKIIDHISGAEGSVLEYKRLKNNINKLQIKFSLAFFGIVTILISSAILWGRNFAERLVNPIKVLVKAAEEVKNGNLSIQVPEKNLKKDEMRILSSSFNRMIRQINKQQKELVIAQRAAAWSDVARQVAHEIKNPLTPIQLSANRLESKFSNQVDDRELFKKYINNILNKSNDIKIIVSEFVNFARLPAPTFSKCNIAKLVGDIVDSKKLINDKINYYFSSQSPIMQFVCDITQITQVLENLLQNAEDSVQSRPQQSSGEFIKVSLNHDKLTDIVTILISDSGTGFSEELLQKAKVPYVTTKAKGTGLGLAIADRIVQDHFGSLEINNNPEGGATIKLNFEMRLLNEKIKK